MALEDINITTEFGNITLPSQKLYDFILYASKESKKHADIRQTQIEEYFEGIEFNNEYFHLTHLKVPAYLKCMWEVIRRDYEVVRLTNYSSKHHSESPPKGFDFKISLHDSENLFLDCVVYLKCKNSDEKLVLMLMPYNDGDMFSLEIEASYSQKGNGFRGFWKRVKDYFKTEGPLKNALFNTSWEYVDFAERDWDSIVITDKDKNNIQRNVINFLANLEKYKELRLPTSRGILLTGPPGTGKTLLCETIMNQVECTKIYVTSDSVERAGDIKDVYKTARKLAPSIVIIEDIDTLGGLDRREGGNHPLLGEFLNCLNGVGTNEGVVTLATTNYPKHLDIALIDRPGRIDLRIEFGLPDVELREHIFRKYLGELEHDEIDYKQLARKSENMTGAYIREIVMTGYLISQENNSNITQKIMLESLDSVVNMKATLNGPLTDEGNYHN